MKSPIESIGMLEVDRDISGGVRIKLGGVATVLSPHDAIKFGSAVLKACGCGGAFAQPEPRQFTSAVRRNLA